MYYTIYKIMNMLNGKFYIGKHKTRNLDDGYMGSGKLIKRAIEKYGVENFKKEILHIFETEAEMNEAEVRLVVLGEDSYNLCPGGRGGFGYVNQTRDHKTHNRAIASKRSYKEPKLVAWHSSPEKAKAMRNAHKEGKYAHTYFTNRCDYKTFAERANTPEAIAKRKETFKLTGHQSGEKNSQYGTMWITDGSINKKIRSSDSVPDGWYRGRSKTVAG